VFKRYHVDLTRREHTEFQDMLNKGIVPVRMLTRARIQLAADENKADAEIAATRPPSQGSSKQEDFLWRSPAATPSRAAGTRRCSCWPIGRSNSG
jgi:hypothetical protein